MRSFGRRKVQAAHSLRLECLGLCGVGKKRPMLGIGLFKQSSKAWEGLWTKNQIG